MAVDYSITEHIPVADHVHKYLLKKCGGPSYIANRNDIIGNIILSSLGRHPDVKYAKSTYTKTFNVIIREHSYLRNGVFLSMKSGQVFNKMIDKMFREELYTHVFINKSMGHDMSLKSMRQFLDIFNITEDDIKLESLYRDYKRKNPHLEKHLT